MSLFQSLLQTLAAWGQGSYAPLLPSVASAHACLCVSWSAVLLFFAGPALQRFKLSLPAQRMAALALVVLTCLPTPWGLAGWLGLAFQSPSVLTTLVCAWVVAQRLAPHRVPVIAVASWGIGSWLAVALGLILLLDVLAVFPFSLYAWGFNPLALGLLTFAACLPWLVSGQRALSGLLILSLLVHLLLRWPTGNVWDVWVDPGLALYLLARQISALRPRQTPSATTRA